jgi:hypothetical protein
VHKTIFNVTFYLSQNGGICGYARLEVNLPFAPSHDIEIEHPVWKEPKKVKNISYNINEDYFFVDFEIVTIDTPDSKTKDVYSNHGWIVT